jgi:D-serine deaminase-like pyridoxal phosphate-dependent protein
MLRASSQTTATEVDLRGIEGDAEAAARGIEHGRELMRFAEALAQRDEAALARARSALQAAAGPAVLVDAAGVAANFQRMVRIADSIGIPVDNLNTELSREVRATLQLAHFASARHSLE